MSRPDRFQLEPLLRQALTGDATALNTLLSRLRPYLYFLTRQQLGNEGAVAMQQSDVVQSSLRRIFQNFGSLDNPSVPQFLAWVGRIVHNRSTDEFRRARNRMPTVNTPVLANLSERLPWEQIVERDRRAMLVAAALEQLAPRKRQIVEMFFLDQMSDAEICEKIGGSQQAIRVLRHRALKELRQRMENPE